MDNMENCRILTPKDAVFLPQYVQILRTGLDKIAQVDERSKIDETVALYTEEYLQRFLQANQENRLVGHFDGKSLDGILIEGKNTIDFDQLGIKDNITLIKWIVSQQSGNGIGSELLQDCITRAKYENKDAVALSVAERNQNARRIYQKYNFQENGNENGMIGMYYYLNPRMDPANWAGGSYHPPKAE